MCARVGIEPQASPVPGESVSEVKFQICLEAAQRNVGDLFTKGHFKFDQLESPECVEGCKPVETRLSFAKGQKLGRLSKPEVAERISRNGHLARVWKEQRGREGPATRDAV